MKKANRKTWGWIVAAAGVLVLGGCACGLIRSLRPGLPAAAPFTLPEEDWVEWQEGGGTPGVLKSAIRWNDTLYYALPGDRRTVVLEEPLARVDQGLPWFEDLFFREYLQRVGYDDKGEFLYRGIAHGSLLYATREAAERISSPKQTLTGLYIGYEADARITDPADMETLRRLETIQGKTVRYKTESSAAYSYSISYMYNDLPLLHWEATIARIDGQFVYVKSPWTAVRYGELASPSPAAASKDYSEGVAIADPETVRALLDIRVDGEPVFALEGWQGTAL